MHPSEALITRFYEAFQRRDGAAMAACYAPDATFSDPAFPDLRGPEVGGMWRMLTARAQDFSLTFRDVHGDDKGGTAHWEATYTFTKTGRRVHNVIDATFEIRDGRIVKHVDRFDFSSWAKQALGAIGYLGFLPPIRKAVQREARQNLERFMAKEGEGKAS